MPDEAVYGTLMGRKPNKSKAKKAPAAPTAPADPNDIYNFDVSSLFGKDGQGLDTIDTGGVMKYLGGLQNAARAANEKRYTEGLDTIKSGYGSAMDIYGGAGDQAVKDIGMQFAEQGAQTDQSLLTRGLYNTTILDALKNRNTEASARAQAAARESFAAGKAGIAERGANATAGFIAGRTDEYPDVGPYATLIGQNSQQRAASQARKDAVQQTTGDEQVGGGYEVNPYTGGYQYRPSYSRPKQIAGGGFYSGVGGA